ncbi:MAG: hypothetical protein ACI97D_001403, partial [Porticoccaceae bacterium]
LVLKPERKSPLNNERFTDPRQPQLDPTKNNADKSIVL